MRIVVTGALGHIGSQFIRALPASFPGADVLLVDDLSSQRFCSLFDLPQGARFRFCEADIRTAELASLFGSADVVVHLAAITNATESFANRNEVESVNVAGTQRVADACIDAGSPLIFLSTTSVYGTQGDTVDEECPVTALRPQSPYATTKLQAEADLVAAGERGLRHVTCRFGTIFGPSPGMRFHTAINRFCWQATVGQPITVWRTAMNQKRPYLDVNDAVRALLFIVRRQLFDGRIYNVVTANSTVGEIIRIIQSRIPDAAVELVDTLIMNQLSYEVSSSRFREAGFVAEGDLEAGINATLSRLSALGSPLLRPELLSTGS